MDRDKALNVARIGFAGLTVVAILVQISDLTGKGVFNPANFFSFFTIQSNLIAVVVLTITAWRSLSGKPPTRTWDLVRGGAVLYMTVTFIVFALLLSNTDVDTAVPWVNSVVHEVFPIVMLADWLLDPPGRRLSIQDALVWLAFPLVWVGCSLIRGPLAGWYPYPFLDPANGGYGTVAAYVVAILVLGLILIAVLVKLANIARSGRGGAAWVA
jgi:hypothetical protein